MPGEKMPSCGMGGRMPDMRSSADVLSDQFLQMRERCLSLAADFDRLARSPGGLNAISNDPRLAQLQHAIGVVLDARPEKARRVLESLSDHTPYQR